jgi:hypothetical protein
MPQIRPLLTNGFRVELPETIDVLVREFPHPREVKAERLRLDGFWFVHWVGGKLYHLRLRNGGPNVDGAIRPLRIADHPWLLRARIDDVIGDAVSQYEPIRVRPFTFLAHKAELIGPAAAAAGVAHPLLSGFKVTPRFVLNAKVYEPTGNTVGVGVFVKVGTHYEINVPLPDLQRAGIDLAGMYVVRRAPEKGQRRLAGRIARLTGSELHLSESTDGDVVAADSVKLEGSRENVARCLTGLLGTTRYKALTNALDDEQAAYLRGPDFDAVVERMGSHLARTPLRIAQGYEARIGDRIVLQSDDTCRSVYLAPPVDYVFDRTGAKSDGYAWPGLSRFGPYDRATFTGKSPRLLVVFSGVDSGQGRGVPSSLPRRPRRELPGLSKGLPRSLRPGARRIRDVSGDDRGRRQIRRRGRLPSRD